MVREEAGSSEARPLATLRATALATEREARRGLARDRRAARLAGPEPRRRGRGADAAGPGGVAASRAGAPGGGARAATVRAPASGIVLTPRLEERPGTSLAEGDLLLTLGRTDTLELELGVRQRDILRVRPGQAVRLRVDALPQRTFEGRSPRSPSSPCRRDGSVLFPVRARDPQSGRPAQARDGRARASADRSRVHRYPGLPRRPCAGPGSPGGGSGHDPRSAR